MISGKSWSEEKEPFHIPMPGQRIARSVFAVFLCFVIYFLRGKQGIPFYSALAVLQCMQPYQTNTVRMGKQRLKGTLIGAFWGLLMILLEVYAFRGALFGTLAFYAMISVFTGVVLYSTVLLNCRETAYFSGVVFLSITVVHIGDANPFQFVANRVLDTLIGVMVALPVNALHLPRKKRRDVLFVSGLDDTILTHAERLTSFSRVELNRLLDQGANFTVSTLRTPAGIREVFSGVRLRLPVIAMDGAVLYDLETNSYLRTYQMSPEQAARIEQVLCEAGVGCFTNTVVDDLLAIYYRELSNEAQKKIFEQMHRSPYRNYVRRARPEDEPVVYFMIIEPGETIQRLYQKLISQPWAGEYKIITYDSRDYPGYAYIKIYDREATRENMLKHLCAMLKLEKTVTFGSVEGKYDICVRNSDRNEMVRALKREYEPLIWAERRRERSGK